jgi:hypothetical protein
LSDVVPNSHGIDFLFDASERGRRGLDRENVEARPFRVLCPESCAQTACTLDVRSGECVATY